MNRTKLFGSKNPFFGHKHTKETKRKNAEWHRNRTCSEATKKKMSIFNKGKTLTEEHRKKISIAKKGMISPMKGKHFSTQHKENMRLSQLNKKHNMSEQGRKNISNNMKKRMLTEIFPKKNTKPERFLQTILSVNEIEYQTHARIFGRPDIFIEPNICIFVDGHYWHTLPKIIERDKLVNKKLKELGYIILRIWDYEIYESL